MILEIAIGFVLIHFLLCIGFIVYSLGDDRYGFYIGGFIGLIELLVTFAIIGAVCWISWIVGKVALNWLGV